MKKLLLSIVIVMALTSCEKEEPLQPEPVQNQTDQIDDPQPYDPSTDPTYVKPPNVQWCGCCQMKHPYVQYPPLYNGPRHPVQKCN